MVLQKKLEKERFEVAVMENAFFSFEDIVYEIINQMQDISSQPFLLNKSEMPARGDKYGLMKTLKNNHISLKVAILQIQ